MGPLLGHRGRFRCTSRTSAFQPRRLLRSLVPWTFPSQPGPRSRPTPSSPTTSSHLHSNPSNSPSIHNSPLNSLGILKSPSIPHSPSRDIPTSLHLSILKYL